jgi:hypothetical protein
MNYFKNKPAPSLGHQLPLPAAVRDELGKTVVAPPQPGMKRKMMDGVESSGLAKRLVFWTFNYDYCPEKEKKCCSLPREVPKSMLKSAGFPDNNHLFNHFI